MTPVTVLTSGVCQDCGAAAATCRAAVCCEECDHYPARRPAPAAPARGYRVTLAHRCTACGTILPTLDAPRGLCEDCLGDPDSDEDGYPWTSGTCASATVIFAGCPGCAFCENEVDLLDGARR